MEIFDYGRTIKNTDKKIGLEILKLIDELPNKPAAWAISRQIVRSSTSIGANYRAACRAKSSADFVHKLKIVEEEQMKLTTDWKFCRKVIYQPLPELKT